MSFYIDDYIEAFLTGIEKSKNKKDYIKLLEQAELMCLELLNTLDGEEYDSFFEESPLLAMVAEIQKVCPEAVIEKAENSVIFSTAAMILSQYSDDDLAFLRRHYLKRDDRKIVYLDFNKKKR